MSWNSPLHICYHEWIVLELPADTCRENYSPSTRGGGGTFGILGGSADGTLEALAYTRASLAKFCYPIPD